MEKQCDKKGKCCIISATKSFFSKLCKSKEECCETTEKKENKNKEMGY